jgi:hypothetical protein
MDTISNPRYRVGSVEFLEQVHIVLALTKTTISLRTQVSNGELLKSIR